jgi:predicted nucleic acid-binding protein
LFVSDDLKARQTATSFNIPVTGTLGILVACIKSGIISKGIGNDLLRQMIEAGYRSPIDNLDNLLGELPLGDGG